MCTRDRASMLVMTPTTIVYSMAKLQKGTNATITKTKAKAPTKKKFMSTNKNLKMIQLTAKDSPAQNQPTYHIENVQSNQQMIRTR